MSVIATIYGKLCTVITLCNCIDVSCTCTCMSVRSVCDCVCSHYMLCEHGHIYIGKHAVRFGVKS